MSFIINICVASLDGSLSVWSYADGSCITSCEKIVKCNPTTIAALPSGKHVACAGRHTDIEIVNLNKQKVVSILSAHQNWVTSLYACDLRPNSRTYYCFKIGILIPSSGPSNPILMSSSLDGIINFWSLKKGESLHPWETVVVEKGEPISVSLSPNFKSFLIVTTQKLMV